MFLAFLRSPRCSAFLSSGSDSDSTSISLSLPASSEPAWLDPDGLWARFCCGSATAMSGLSRLTAVGGTALACAASRAARLAATALNGRLAAEWEAAAGPCEIVMLVEALLVVAGREGADASVAAGSAGRLRFERFAAGPAILLAGLPVGAFCLHLPGKGNLTCRERNVELSAVNDGLVPLVTPFPLPHSLPRAFVLCRSSPNLLRAALGRIFLFKKAEHYKRRLIQISFGDNRVCTAAARPSHKSTLGPPPTFFSAFSFECSVQLLARSRKLLDSHLA